MTRVFRWLRGIVAWGLVLALPAAAAVSPGLASF